MNNDDLFHIKMKDIFKYEMICYRIIYSFLTMVFFSILFKKITLPGGSVGMTPFFVALALLIVFVVETVIVLAFKKYFTRLKNKLILLIIVFLMFELTVWILGGFEAISILESFRQPYEENLSRTISLASVLSLAVIFVLMLLMSILKKRYPDN
jgi:hypothetical protein